ncbi:NADH-ubiquinone oxidoreductase chain 1 [Actinomortierella wolfii]|nr:NADH-ubiquinone oxidoreductase chain 1 [Actinomortierella wolfii]
MSSGGGHQRMSYMPGAGQRAPSRQQQLQPHPPRPGSSLAGGMATSAAAGQRRLPFGSSAARGPSPSPTPTTPAKAASTASSSPQQRMGRSSSNTSLPATSSPTPVLPPLAFHQPGQRGKQGDITASVNEAFAALSTSTSTSSGAGNEGQQGPSKTENVTVTVRVRPMSASELKVAHGGPGEVWAVTENAIGYTDEYMRSARRPPTEYTFDHALTGSDNALIYETAVKDLVRSAMEGYNGTVFAYGQTSSGKTYTGTEKEPGVTPRAVEEIFKYISENSDREFLLRVSFLEIYNETIRDLLSPEAIDLRIHEDRRVIESRERAPGTPSSPTARRPSLRPGGGSTAAVRVSQLNLIDLAGSEKASSDVARRKEGAYINKSLLTLGTVIAKLTEEKGAHIPYRDSKLTRLLQNSLSGNARVSVICTISPSFVNVEESHNTLKFAARVKKVVTKAHTNQVMDDKALLEKYRREISELKAQLLLTGGGEGVDKEKQAELSTLLEKERLKHEEDMAEMNRVRQALKERIDHLTRLILTSQSVDSKALVDGSIAAGGSAAAVLGRSAATVEISADGSALEFPKEIETRLARKETVVRQLQSELEAEKEKAAVMKAALQKAAQGDTADIGKILARLESAEQAQPRERFLLEKRASIMNLNSVTVQNSADMQALQALKQMQEANASNVSAEKSSPSLPQDDELSGHVRGGEASIGREEPPFPVDGEDPLADEVLEGATVMSEEDLLEDTPWNRAELQSLRQAKRELEIIVIEQEQKIQDMVAFEDSEDFRNMVLELEEQRTRILELEEERESLKATVAELRNTVRKLELHQQNGHARENQATNGTATGYSPSSSPSSTMTSVSAGGAMENSDMLEPANRIQELEQMLLKERRIRIEEQSRSLGRIASLEAELTIVKAELNVQQLHAGYV